MTIKEIREKYLRYFESNNHTILPSEPLLPENDPTTLFTVAGMQPILPYLLGEEHAGGTRLTNSQKCFRSDDIDEVGDNRHTTFFEMLGNWSLGDYFKEEQVTWLYNFLVKELGLDPNRLYITAFAGQEDLGIPKDEEVTKQWQKLLEQDGVHADIREDAAKLGMQDGRIFYYDAKKNWWSRAGIPENMPEGEPGGPDSEVFWDFGKELGLHEASEFKDQPCHVNCDCGRFFEIGNSVFMEYQKTADGLVPLPKKNVDFGGGLERIAVALTGTPDIFMIDCFDEAKKVIELASGKTYGQNKEETRAFRVILDHMRASTFLIGDGAIPSNKDQGYFVRRLIRRSIRFAQQIGVQTDFCAEVGKAFVEAYEAYPALLEKKELIITELVKEEEKFRKTLMKGEKEFEKRLGKKGAISGEDAFILYSTYGFPLELTVEMAEEKGVNVNEEVFRKEFDKHRDLSRAGAAQKFAGGLADHSETTIKLHTATHLLHEALRKVLGDHVAQKGSNITEKRLRFDFSHPEKLNEEQVKVVEMLVNEQIKKGLGVRFESMSLEEAKEVGAIGLFEDKYKDVGDQVKVYFMEDDEKNAFSTEVCGGPHVENLAELGEFKIKKQESVGAGVRRIKAILTSG